MLHAPGCGGFRFIGRCFATMLSLEPAEGRAYGSASGLGFIRVAISTAATTNNGHGQVMRAILSSCSYQTSAPPGALSTHYDSIERMKLQIF